MPELAEHAADGWIVGSVRAMVVLTVEDAEGEEVGQITLNGYLTDAPTALAAFDDMPAVDSALIQEDDKEVSP
ncbi:MAG: hypothetical protein V7607_1194 [Solirubrobacteraceae bacterium]